MPHISPATLVELVDLSLQSSRTTAFDISFNEIWDMYKSGELIINPTYQRNFRWDPVRQSQFIESLILALPIPPIYAVEIKDNVFELIDGLQRISTYLRFRGEPVGAGMAEEGSSVSDSHDDAEEGEEDELETALMTETVGVFAPEVSAATGPFVLDGCDIMPELNGQSYDSLPLALQIRLKRHFIRMEVLRKASRPDLRYRMFKRLNSGAALLSNQELRNCTIRLLDPADTFNTFVKRLASNSDYVSCMATLTKSRRKQLYMDEFVLRFFALKNNMDEYVKDFAEFLTKYMESVSSGKAQFDYDIEENQFKLTFWILNKALKERAFAGVNQHRTVIKKFSTLHFEALTLGLQSKLEELAALDDDAREQFGQELLAIKVGDDFLTLTAGSKNHKAIMKKRVEYIQSSIARILSQEK